MPLFESIFVANRGEIAIRVMRACRDLGIRSIAVYGCDERTAPHVRYADDAYRLESEFPIPYLDVDAILSVARKSGAQAIHPGYGFLAENAVFARSCASADITFIGPSPQSIESMGDKVRAREIASGAGVPVVPGSDSPVSSESVAGEAEAIGFPVALKASAGGGGRGFRVAYGPSELADAFDGATGEGTRYFNDGRVYIERYFENPRHVEIQVLADTHGNAVALGERDCSIQRRHQKLIEESPSPALTPAMREAMEDAAVRLAKVVDYAGAGTVEFLVQGEQFFFLEMNTRIQVEHPVTEMITGTDLVAEQIRIAAGESIAQERYMNRSGHAIECRINAEDALSAFQPVSGTITECRLPYGPGVRFDGAIETGQEVSPRYDSLLGKLVVWGSDRAEAIGRLRRALSELEISGIATTVPFHRAVVDHPIFESGDYDTRFLERHPEVVDEISLDVSNVASQSNPEHVEQSTYLVEVNGRRFDVRVYRQEQQSRRPPTLASERASSTVALDGSETIVSPIQGTVLSVAVSEGDSVRAGDVVCVVEAMKMENEIAAGRDGTVTSLQVRAGSTIDSGGVIAIIESGESSS